MPKHTKLCSDDDMQFMQDRLNEFMIAAANRKIDYVHVATSLQRAGIHMAVMAGVSDPVIVQGVEMYIPEARMNVAKAEALKPS